MLRTGPIGETYINDKYTCMFDHSTSLKWRIYLKSLWMKDKYLLITNSLYHSWALVLIIMSLIYFSPSAGRASRESNANHLGWYGIKGSDYNLVWYSLYTNLMLSLPLPCRCFVLVICFIRKNIMIFCILQDYCLFHNIIWWWNEILFTVY